MWLLERNKTESSQNHSKKNGGGEGGGGIGTSFGAFKILSRAEVMSRNEREGEEGLLV